MIRRLLASYLALTIAILASLEIPLAVVNQRNEQRDLTARVERDAFVAAALAEDALHAQRATSGLRSLAAHYRTETGGRMVIVDRHGISVADSHPTTPGERNFAGRPEVAAALVGRTVAGIRGSQTLGERLLYVAVPVTSGGAVLGAVRITYPTSTLDHRIWRYRVALALVALLVLVAAATIGVLLARSIAGPLRRLEVVARRMGGGELQARASEDDGPLEVRRLARELNSSAVKVGALLRSQEQFVADASHELRTPLQALRLRLDTGDAAAATAEVERLAGLIDDLLALARADASSAPAAEVALGDIVRSRAAHWRPLAAEHGVTLSADTASAAKVVAGTGRVEQVLDNLLSNALAVSPPGGLIEIEAANGEVHIVDQGPGLSDEQRGRAFDRFWRAGSGPGSGLGLAIAKQLVELDGGTIALEPAPSGGLDAVVRYPISRA